MAMTSYTPRLMFKGMNYAGGSVAAPTLNSTDDWSALVAYWPGGDLTKCLVMATAVSGSPVGTVQFFNMDASSPAALDLASPIGSAVDTATLVANVPQVVSGIGQAALAAGFYAQRTIFKSGTSFAMLEGYGGTFGGGAATIQEPYSVRVTDGGAQAIQNNTGYGISWGDATGWKNLHHIPPHLPITAQAVWNSADTPDEYGIRFTNPYPYSVRLCGVHFYNNSGSRPDIGLTLYDSGPTSPNQVFSQTFSRSKVRSLSTAGYNTLQFSDANRYTLAAGATCWIGINALTAHNVGFSYMSVGAGDQALLDTFWGQNVYMFSRKDGDLTEITTQTPLIYVWYDGEDYSKIRPVIVRKTSVF